MILCLLDIAISVTSVLALIYVLIYIKKAGVSVWKPFGLGVAVMLIGYFGSAFLLLAVDAVTEAATGSTFVEDDITALYLALTTAIILTLMMFLMLKKPLASNRSAYEVLTFGVGIVFPAFLYRTVSVTLSDIAYIVSGADYGTAALLLLSDILGMAGALLEAFLAIVLAYMMGKDKPWKGFFAVLAAMLLSYAGGSVQTAFGWSGIVGYSIGTGLSAAAAVAGIKVWKDLPPIKQKQTSRGFNSNIQWPDKGEDGR